MLAEAVGSDAYRRRFRFRRILAAALFTLAGPDLAGPARAVMLDGGWQLPARPPDVPFVPTPDEVIPTMLDLARVTGDDVVFDLGSGDGRILIAAAQRFGARGVGIEIDPVRVREARDRARAGGVDYLITFREQDFFDADISDATVVMLYLMPRVNLQLRPRLLAELRPGTRIVSHTFDMGDWTPAESRYVRGRPVHLWIVPPR
jgi:SAM-dependent methyltransferase